MLNVLLCICSFAMSPFSRYNIKTEIDSLKYQQHFNFYLHVYSIHTVLGLWMVEYQYLLQKPYDMKSIPSSWWMMHIVTYFMHFSNKFYMENICIYEEWRSRLGIPGNYLPNIYNSK